MAFNYEINQLELMQARIKSVPHGWQFTYVGKAFCIRNNLRKPISEEERSMSPGNYPYYGPTKIQGYIGTFEQDGSYALIGEDGDHFLKFEKHSMTQLVDGKCTVNNHAHIIEGTKEASREWFYYYFMHRDIFSFLSRQGAGRYKLNKASLEKMPLLLPPIVEQKKIAQILSTWDKAITVTEKLLANSQQQKKALMQQLLTGEKRLLDENGVRFVGKWEKKHLSDVADVYQPKTISQSMMSDSGYPVYGANGVIGFYQEFNHETEQIAVTCRGSTCGTVNWTQAKSWITGNAMVINTDSYSFVNKKFLFYTLNGSDLKYLISGSGQPQITGNIKTHIVNLPCIEEQQKIATVLSAADAEISTLEKKLACLKDEKKALMQQLLTGKRRVKVEAEEAVSA
ncbi:restriction endonuclease subunit S [Citrobacter freundii]|uniref:restriction endonuclease subunit S n=1 Tax=Citrobacter freundii TaxID=546 RepID=UPI00162579CB|nr:restriction endonuclease subunit S [Citrobacter freundii]MBE8729677.1 restriction endonuclease subunit S [Citrobacter freundii]MBJ8730148.1 restriction endonuclease subunit S [Citrobacter freundii]UNM04802.1 restriction endonuclease subunit S [Citrobacter freundii]HAT4395464.1 restriction endonuclease subunit S [Citrobacter freundii]HAU5789340.1 restriction endonuclease subunit S [Citrobacter freundii]